MPKISRRKRLEMLDNQVTRWIKEDNLTVNEARERIEKQLFGEGFSHTTVESYLFALSCRGAF